LDFETNLQQDLMYKGYTIQPYSPKRNWILHEVNQPGSYRDVTDTTVVAQFKAIEATLPTAFKGFGAVESGMDYDSLDSAIEHRTYCRSKD
jgi:hypothetical protein